MYRDQGPFLIHVPRSETQPTERLREVWLYDFYMDEKGSKLDKLMWPQKINVLSSVTLTHTSIHLDAKVLTIIDPHMLWQLLSPAIGIVNKYPETW